MKQNIGIANGIKLCLLGLAAWSGASVAADETPKNNVEFYGKIDIGGVLRTDPVGVQTGHGTDAQFVSGAGPSEPGTEAGSFVGVRGNRLISKDITAIFALEAGLNVTNGAANNSANTYSANTTPLFARQAYVGATGSWGTALGGRLEGGRAGVVQKYDPFGGGTVAGMGAQIHITQKADNAVAYVTPSWNNFSAVVAYTTQLFGQSTAGNVWDNRVYAVIPTYEKGNLSVTYDHEAAWYSQAGVSRLQLDILAGSYDFTAVKLYAYAERVSVDTPIASSLAALQPLQSHNAYMLGAAIPINASTKLRTSFVENKDTGDVTCTQYGIGLQHYLDKDSSVYIDAAAITNSNGSKCSIAYNTYQNANDNGGLTSSKGFGTRGMDMGFIYKF